ncbi:MAG TPA: MarR family transcriptional regulator [Candidatus Monoglobus merdigallinarum]|uniref:MarR family transcriptional regulator n=1 Tax=Candidatus Monoglobus merdigallinarum TaxID=2838698 RepID=A0A9D1TL46_9FIRM|nr:MarR family transcriptional regulator [Candidatus Monoglobus merdigallinarum]
MNNEFALVSDRLEAAFNAITQLVSVMNEEFSDLPVSSKEFFILKTIYSRERRGEHITATELSRIFCVSKPAITQFAASLKKNGYIVKKKSSDDRRITHIALTKKAYDLINDIDKYLYKRFDFTKEFGTEKFNQLLNLIDEFVEAIKSKHNK